MACCVAHASVLLGISLSVGGPALVQAQDSSVPLVPASVRYLPDLAFRAHDADTIRLDLLLPASGDPAAAIVIIGNPAGGNRSEALWDQATFLASLGFAAVLIDHRPRAVGGRMPIAAAVSDTKLTVRWLRAHASAYGIDGSRIGMMGAGHGGLVAALAGLPHWFGVGSNDNVRYSSAVGAVALIDAPLDLADGELSAAVADYLDVVVATRPATRTAGSEHDLPLREGISPVHFFSGGAGRDVREHVPPFLLLHGTADEHVPFRHADDFARELRAHGYSAEVFVAEEARHGFFREPAWRDRVLTALSDFFRRSLMDTVYHAGWSDSRPVWSPDGLHIAFQSEYGGERAVWVMRADGSDLRRIAAGAEAGWSPDGSRLAFEAGDGRLASIRLDGSDFALLTRDTTEFVYAVSWSPDGTHIAYSNWADNQLYALRLADGHVRRLTDGSGGNGCASWSPDGSRLVFHSSRDGQSELYALALASGELERLTHSAAHEFCPALSPDGRRLVFQRRTADVHEHIDLFVMDLDGSTEMNLTDHFANDRYASWSPDGIWIAFASTRGGNSDIYIVRTDATELRRLTHR
jgi:WD40 repeat protein/acetyl esterase/lipase